MTSYRRAITTFFLSSSILLTALGGCSNIAEAIDCDQMCTKMHDCIDSDIDVGNCSERCEDKVDDNELAEKLDACTDCLDRGYSCAEINDECTACDDVQIALLD